MTRSIVWLAALWICGALGCEKQIVAETGADVYAVTCQACHGIDGRGVSSAFPPLVNSSWARGDKGRLIRLVLNGMRGPLVVKGREYNNVMSPHDFLSDRQIAEVLSFVRNSFSNAADSVTIDDVRRVRAANDRVGFWEPAALRQAVGIPNR